MERFSLWLVAIAGSSIVVGCQSTDTDDYIPPYAAHYERARAFPGRPEPVPGHDEGWHHGELMDFREQE